MSMVRQHAQEYPEIAIFLSLASAITSDRSPTAASALARSRLPCSRRPYRPTRHHDYGPAQADLLPDVPVRCGLWRGPAIRARHLAGRNATGLVCGGGLHFLPGRRL